LSATPPARPNSSPGFPEYNSTWRKRPGSWWEGHLLPCLAACPPAGCYDARVQRLGEIVCRALGACVALGVELGYSERATEFVHRLLQESPEPED